MKFRKKFLKIQSIIILKLKKIIRYIRMYHPIEYIKSKLYLRKNKIEEIEIQNTDNIKINFLGTTTNEYLKNINFYNIKEINNALNFVDAPKNLRKNKNIFFSHFDNQMVIFKNKNIKIAYISFIPQRNLKKDLSYLRKLVMSARIKKSDFVIVYIKNKENNILWEKCKQINKILGCLGADYIIYSDKKGQARQHLIKIYRLDKPTYITKSIDNFFNDIGISSVIHLDLNVDKKNSISEYYFLIKNSNGIAKYLNLKKNKNILNYYNNNYLNLNEKNNRMVLKDILKIIGLECPEKYKNLEKVGVKKICGKWSEVTQNDVLFLLEPYKYKNDTTTATDEDRLRQVKRAVSKGVLFIISYMELDKSIPHVVCKNVREAHIKMCNYLHKKNNITTIAITGSVGKTTTKDMLGAVFNQKYNVLKSPKNGNLQIQIGQNIQKIKPINEVYIQEIGGGRPGGSSRHSRMINPDMAMITNIGTAHLGNFKDQKELMLNKLGIIDGLKQKGVFFQNLDDKLLKKAKITKRKVITYSVENKKADYYGSNILFEENRMKFYINKKETKEKWLATLNVLGIHNVQNAIVCFAMADYYGLTPSEILAGLENFKTKGIRQNLVKIANQVFSIDCFNASIDSVSASLKTFDKYELENIGKKIVVLGDLTGIGDSEEKIHHKIADELMKYHFDEIILYGNSIKITSEDLNKKNIKNYYIKFPHFKKLNKKLKKLISTNDVVLLKGSSKLSLEYQIDLLYGTNLACSKFIDELEYQSIPGKHYKYRIFDDFCILYKFKGKNKKIHVKNSLFNKKVRAVYNNCFKNNKHILKVYLNKSCVHIGNNAFNTCKRLKSIKMKNVKYIGEKAFYKCNALVNVKLNEGIMHISSKAFAYCPKLKSIYLPESVVQIDDNVFKCSKKVLILCKENSLAQKYAIENKIKYKCI